MDDAIIADDGYAQAFADVRQRGDTQAIAFREIPDQRIGKVLVIPALFADEESLAAGFIDEQAIPRQAREGGVASAGKANLYPGLPIARLDPLAGQRLTPVLAEVACAVPAKLRGNSPESCDRPALPVSDDARVRLHADASPLIGTCRYQDRKYHGGEGSKESVRHFRLAACAMYKQRPRRNEVFIIKSRLNQAACFCFLRRATNPIRPSPASIIA